MNRVVIPLALFCLFLAIPGMAQEVEDPHDPHDLSLGPKLLIKGFTDISFGINQDENENTFALGQFDLFITSELSEKFTFLSEVVYRFGRDNRATLDLERVQIKYSHSDQVNLVLGRMHTPLGYWNETYHHGAWFQTTAFRPEMLDSNVLPQHEIGLQFTGRQRFSAFDFEYNFSVANGRAKSITDNQNLQDLNGFKAVNILVKAFPEAVPGLSFGFNSYTDKIPADPAVAGRTSELDEQIWGAHVVYLNGKVEFLTEYAHIEHEDVISSQEYITNGTYIQGAYQFEWLKPYYRFDYLDFGEGDPFYAPILLDQKKHTAGVRYDPILWLGIKLEYSHTDPRVRDSWDSFIVQTAFTF